MRQAIVTKYLGPTNYRGARVKATCQAGSVTLAWDDALDVNGNHDAAAKALTAKVGWSVRLYGGSLPDGTGNCYVWDDHVVDCIRVYQVHPSRAT